MYCITPEHIAQLKADGYDVWEISLWEDWLTFVPRVKAAKQLLADVFADVRLDGGTGLRMAETIDMYAGLKEQAEAFEADKDHANSSWRNITTEELNRYHVAPSFFDAKGFLFHLPAFLLAELNDKYEQDFMFHFLAAPDPNQDWIHLLTDDQRDVLVEILEILKHHPDHYGRPKQLDDQISRLTQAGSTAG